MRGGLFSTRSGDEINKNCAMIFIYFMVIAALLNEFSCAAPVFGCPQQRRK
jgi:hypothetical protein